MDDSEKNNLIKKINSALDKIRPYLVADGGNVNIVELTDNYEVKVKLTGACGSCPFSLYTLKAGVESAIRQEVPEIKEVSSV